jgi:uncharacterized membrane protein YbhN (UPF0104 family)
MRRIETLIIVLALGFYAWFLHRFGARDVWHYVQMVGWGLAVTIALEAVSRLANTLGWRITIEKCPPKLHFGEMFVARIAGEAIDYVTPSGQLGGQFVMAMMVRRKLAMAVGLATVVVASLAELIGQIGFMSGALLIALPSEAEVHHLLWPVLGGLAIAIGLAAGFFYAQMKQPFSLLWKAAAKLQVGYLANPEVKAAAGEADAILIDFYANHRGRLIGSCLCYLVAWSMGPLEIFILLKFLHQPATWMVVLLIEAVGLLIERATFLIPGKLVSQEGGKALIFSLLGYPADLGFAIGFLRRIKEMAWVAFGLIGLIAHRMVTGRDYRTANARDNVIEMQGAQGGQSL